MLIARTVFPLCRQLAIPFWDQEITSTNVLRIRNCSAYSEPITSHALGWLAGSRRICSSDRWTDVMAAILKVWRRNAVTVIWLVNWCIFTWRAILPNFIWFETTEPLKSVATTWTRMTKRSATSWVATSDMGSVPDLTILRTKCATV